MANLALDLLNSVPRVLSSASSEKGIRWYGDRVERSLLHAVQIGFCVTTKQITYLNNLFSPVSLTDSASPRLVANTVTHPVLKTAQILAAPVLEAKRTPSTIEIGPNLKDPLPQGHSCFLPDARDVARAQLTSVNSDYVEGTEGRFCTLGVERCSHPATTLIGNMVFDISDPAAALESHGADNMYLALLEFPALLFEYDTDMPDYGVSLRFYKRGDDDMVAMDFDDGAFSYHHKLKVWQNLLYVPAFPGDRCAVVCETSHKLGVLTIRRFTRTYGEGLFTRSIRPPPGMVRIPRISRIAAQLSLATYLPTLDRKARLDALHKTCDAFYVPKELLTGVISTAHIRLDKVFNRQAVASAIYLKSTRITIAGHVVQMGHTVSYKDIGDLLIYVYLACCAERQKVSKTIGFVINEWQSDDRFLPPATLLKRALMEWATGGGEFSYLHYHSSVLAEFFLHDYDPTQHLDIRVSRKGPKQLDVSHEDVWEAAPREGPCLPGCLSALYHQGECFGELARDYPPDSYARLPKAQREAITYDDNHANAIMTSSSHCRHSVAFAHGSCQYREFGRIAPPPSLCAPVVWATRDECCPVALTGPAIEKSMRGCRVYNPTTPDKLRFAFDSLAQVILETSCGGHFTPGKLVANLIAMGVTGLNTYTGPIVKPFLPYILRLAAPALLQSRRTAYGTVLPDLPSFRNRLEHPEPTVELFSQLLMSEYPVYNFCAGPGGDFTLTDRDNWVNNRTPLSKRAHPANLTYHRNICCAHCHAEVQDILAERYPGASIITYADLGVEPECNLPLTQALALRLTRLHFRFAVVKLQAFKQNFIKPRHGNQELCEELVHWTLVRAPWRTDEMWAVLAPGSGTDLEFCKFFKPVLPPPALPAPPAPSCPQAPEVAPPAFPEPPPSPPQPTYAGERNEWNHESLCWNDQTSDADPVVIVRDDGSVMPYEFVYSHLPATHELSDLLPDVPPGVVLPPSLTYKEAVWAISWCNQAGRVPKIAPLACRVCDDKLSQFLADGAPLPRPASNALKELSDVGEDILREELAQSLKGLQVASHKRALQRLPQEHLTVGDAAVYTIFGTAGSAKSHWVKKNLEPRSTIVLSPTNALMQDFVECGFRSHVVATFLGRTIRAKNIVIDEVFLIHPAVIFIASNRCDNLYLIGDPDQIQYGGGEVVPQPITLHLERDAPVSYVSRTVPRDVAAHIRAVLRIPIVTTSQLEGLRWHESGAPQGTPCFTKAHAAIKGVKTVAALQGTRPRDFTFEYDPGCEGLLRDPSFEFVALTRGVESVTVYTQTPGEAAVRGYKPFQHACDLHGLTIGYHSNRPYQFHAAILREVPLDLQPNAPQPDTEHATSADFAPSKFQFGDVTPDILRDVAALPDPALKRSAYDYSSPEGKVKPTKIKGCFVDVGGSKCVSILVPTTVMQTLNAFGLAGVSTVTPLSFYSTDAPAVEELDLPYEAGSPTAAEVSEILARLEPSLLEQSLYHDIAALSDYPTAVNTISVREHITPNRYNGHMRAFLTKRTRLANLPIMGRPFKMGAGAQAITTMLGRFGEAPLTLTRKQSRELTALCFRGIERALRPDADLTITDEDFAVGLLEYFKAASQAQDRRLEQVDIPLLDFLPANEVQTFVKQQVKGDTKPYPAYRASWGQEGWLVKAGQMITAQPKYANDITAGVVRAVTKAFVAALRPDIIWNPGLTTLELHERVKLLSDVNVPGFDMDAKQSDNLRGPWSDDLMRKVYAKFGLTYAQIKLLNLLSASYTVKVDRAYTIKVDDTNPCFQSGRSDTLFSNTVVWLSVALGCFEYDRLTFLAVQGDDVAGRAFGVKYVGPEALEKHITISVADHPSFVGNIISDGVAWDLPRRLAKLATRDFHSDTDIRTYQRSVEDLATAAPNLLHRSIQANSEKYGLPLQEAKALVDYLWRFATKSVTAVRAEMATAFYDELALPSGCSSLGCVVTIWDEITGTCGTTTSFLSGFSKEQLEVVKGIQLQLPKGADDQFLAAVNAEFVRGRLVLYQKGSMYIVVRSLNPSYRFSPSALIAEMGLLTLSEEAAKFAPLTVAGAALAPWVMGDVNECAAVALLCWAISRLRDLYAGAPRMNPPVEQAAAFGLSEFGRKIWQYGPSCAINAVHAVPMHITTATSRNPWLRHFAYNAMLILPTSPIWGSLAKGFSWHTFVAGAENVTYKALEHDVMDWMPLKLGVLLAMYHFAPLFDQILYTAVDVAASSTAKHLQNVASDVLGSHLADLQAGGCPSAASPLGWFPKLLSFFGIFGFGLQTSKTLGVPPASGGNPVLELESKQLAALSAGGSSARVEALEARVEALENLDIAGSLDKIEDLGVAVKFLSNQRDQVWDNWASFAASEPVEVDPGPYDFSFVLPHGETTIPGGQNVWGIAIPARLDAADAVATITVSDPFGYWDGTKSRYGANVVYNRGVYEVRGDPASAPGSTTVSLTLAVKNGQAHMRVEALDGSSTVHSVPCSPIDCAVAQLWLRNDVVWCAVSSYDPLCRQIAYSEDYWDELAIGERITCSTSDNTTTKFLFARSPIYPMPMFDSNIKPFLHTLELEGVSLSIQTIETAIAMAASQYIPDPSSVVLDAGYKMLTTLTLHASAIDSISRRALMADSVANEPGFEFNPRMGGYHNEACTFVSTQTDQTGALSARLGRGDHSARLPFVCTSGHAAEYWAGPDITGLAQVKPKVTIKGGLKLDGATLTMSVNGKVTVSWLWNMAIKVYVPLSSMGEVATLVDNGSFLINGQNCVMSWELVKSGTSYKMCGQAYLPVDNSFSATFTKTGMTTNKTYTCDLVGPAGTAGTITFKPVSSTMYVLYSSITNLEGQRPKLEQSATLVQDSRWEFQYMRAPLIAGLPFSDLARDAELDLMINNYLMNVLQNFRIDNLDDRLTVVENLTKPTAFGVISDVAFAASNFLGPGKALTAALTVGTTFQALDEAAKGHWVDAVATAFSGALSGIHARRSGDHEFDKSPVSDVIGRLKMESDNFPVEAFNRTFAPEHVVETTGRINSSGHVPLDQTSLPYTSNIALLGHPIKQLGPPGEIIRDKCDDLFKYKGDEFLEHHRFPEHQYLTITTPLVVNGESYFSMFKLGVSDGIQTNKSTFRAHEGSSGIPGTPAGPGASMFLYRAKGDQLEPVRYAEVFPDNASIADSEAKLLILHNYNGNVTPDPALLPASVDLDVLHSEIAAKMISPKTRVRAQTQSGLSPEQQIAFVEMLARDKTFQRDFEYSGWNHNCQHFAHDLYQQLAQGSYYGRLLELHPARLKDFTAGPFDPEAFVDGMLKQLLEAFTKPGGLSSMLMQWFKHGCRTSRNGQLFAHRCAPDHAAIAAAGRYVRRQTLSTQAHLRPRSYGRVGYGPTIRDITSGVANRSDFPCPSRPDYRDGHRPAFTLPDRELSLGTAACGQPLQHSWAVSHGHGAGPQRVTTGQLGTGPSRVLRALGLLHGRGSESEDRQEPRADQPYDEGHVLYLSGYGLEVELPREILCVHFVNWPEPSRNGQAAGLHRLQHHAAQSNAFLRFALHPEPKWAYDASRRRPEDRDDSGSDNFRGSGDYRRPRRIYRQRILRGSSGLLQDRADDHGYSRGRGRPDHNYQRLGQYLERLYGYSDQLGEQGNSCPDPRDSRPDWVRWFGRPGVPCNIQGVLLSSQVCRDRRASEAGIYPEPGFPSYESGDSCVPHCTSEAIGPSHLRHPRSSHAYSYRSSQRFPQFVVAWYFNGRSFHSALLPPSSHESAMARAPDAWNTVLARPRTPRINFGDLPNSAKLALLPSFTAPEPANPLLQDQIDINQAWNIPGVPSWSEKYLEGIPDNGYGQRVIRRPNFDVETIAKIRSGQMFVTPLVFAERGWWTTDPGLYFHRSWGQTHRWCTRPTKVSYHFKMPSYNQACKYYGCWLPRRVLSIECTDRAEADDGKNTLLLEYTIYLDCVRIFIKTAGEGKSAVVEFDGKPVK